MGEDWIVVSVVIYEDNGRFGSSIHPLGRMKVQGYLFLGGVSGVY
jgi:hypothetical protein